MLDFDVLRFHPMLNFRRNDELAEGVVGSSGLDAIGVSAVFGGFVSFWARGPVSLCDLKSMFD